MPRPQTQGEGGPNIIDALLYKFRLALMRGAPLSDGANVLVAVSGGPSSCCLLEVMKRFHAIDPANPRKPRKFGKVIVCYVDPSAVLGYPETAGQIAEAAAAADFQCVTVTLESMFLNADESDPGVVNVDGPSTEATLVKSATSSLSPNERLQQCFQSLGTATAKEDMIDLLTNKAILRAARRAGCTLVLRGDTSTRMAVNTVAQTSKGLGFAMPTEMAERPTWPADIEVVRPLRDLSAKQIAIFNRTAKVETFVTPGVTTGMPAKASIDRLTEAFVVGLVKDFPMTVNTVLRTAMKVRTGCEEKETPRCTFCDGPMQEDSQDWRTKHTVTQLQPTSEQDANPPAASVLCYGCQNLCRDRKGALMLPGYILPH
ncbi:Cytoplasmic tRNA 2-thiolation protein 2 [Geranomyces variabilis]|uniref:Cytoplasmic tRNA 2-thiolation protein 2 n=1 Tax=Geranomyces variabilis TaxID=109894 RepID=A0AAD5TCW5_9FUNG|nr:Cytoplasmic tRNA 2-thiolation protein 2 [Geranomyces variabilis]